MSNGKLKRIFDYDRIDEDIVILFTMGNDQTAKKYMAWCDAKDIDKLSADTFPIIRHSKLMDMIHSNKFMTINSYIKYFKSQTGGNLPTVLWVVSPIYRKACRVILESQDHVIYLQDWHDVWGSKNDRLAVIEPGIMHTFKSKNSDISDLFSWNDFFVIPDHDMRRIEKKINEWS